MGPDGLTFQAKTNMSTGHMQIFESNTLQAVKLKRGSNVSQNVKLQRQIIAKMKQQEILQGKESEQ